MEPAAIFVRIARLRRELADLVETLSPEQLATQSLCVGWDVRTVAAHLTLLPSTSAIVFARAALLAGGNIDRAIDRLTRTAAKGRDGRQIAALLRQGADSHAVPPGGGPKAPFTDLLIHRADMCVPLGLPWRPDMADLAVALGFLASSPRGFVPAGRLAGVRLVAQDVGQAWGSGVDAVGDGAELMLAACGRRSGLDALTGPGGELLRSRLTASPSGPPRTS